jgi:hypothetical protein
VLLAESLLGFSGPRAASGMPRRFDEPAANVAGTYLLILPCLAGSSPDRPSPDGRPGDTCMAYD